MPILPASAAPLPSWMVRPRSGRCRTVWPSKPTTATSLGGMPLAARYPHGQKEGEKRGGGGMGPQKPVSRRVPGDRVFTPRFSAAGGLDARAAGGPLTAYVGFDATAPSLHIGNLLTIMMLRWLQKTGHRPIPLMGGGTSKIGDPPGKDTSRTLLTNEQINANITSIQKAFARFLHFDPRTLTADN